MTLLYNRSVAEWVKQTEEAGVLDATNDPVNHQVVHPAGSPARSESPTGYSTSNIVRKREGERGRWRNREIYV